MKTVDIDQTVKDISKSLLENDGTDILNTTTTVQNFFSIFDLCPYFFAKQFHKLYL